MSAPIDALRAKTEAELRFFVENPAFYHPELVEEARRELNRRPAQPAPSLPSPPQPEAGPVAAPPVAYPVPGPEAAPPEAIEVSAPSGSSLAPRALAEPAATVETPDWFGSDVAPPHPAAAVAEHDEAPAQRSPALLLALLAVVLAVAALSFFKLKKTPKPVTPAPIAASAAVRTDSTATDTAGTRLGHLSPDSLKLETVESHVIPSFDVEAIVGEQLASLPAAEKQQLQPFQQFRAMSRRFWAAETQSEYLVSQAHQGKVDTSYFENQTRVARETWHNWNQGVGYSFHFGPVMRKQFDLMKDVASSQQHILTNLPALVANGERMPDKETDAREADVQAWMATLRPKSPVTHKPYKAKVIVLTY